MGDTMISNYNQMIKSDPHIRANQLNAQIEECIRDFEGMFPGWTLNFDVQDGMGLYHPAKKVTP